MQIYREKKVLPDGELNPGLPRTALYWQAGILTTILSRSVRMVFLKVNIVKYMLNINMYNMCFSFSMDWTNRIH